MKNLLLPFLLLLCFYSFGQNFPPSILIYNSNNKNPSINYMEEIKVHYTQKVGVPESTLKADDFPAPNSNSLFSGKSSNNSLINSLINPVKCDKCVYELKIKEKQLTKENLDNIILKKYLDKLKDNNIQPTPINQDKLSFYSSLFEANKINLDSIEIKTKNCNQDDVLYDEKVAQKLVQLKDYFESVNCFFNDVVKNNEVWIEHWLWFTQGKVRINPFGAYDASEKITNTTQNLELIAKQIEVLDKRIACCEIYSEEFKELKLERLGLENEKAKTIKILEKLKEDQKKFLAWKEKYLPKNELIYEFIDLPTSDEDRIVWLYNYSASEELDFLNTTIEPRRFTEPYSIWEDDKAMIAVHNINENQTVKMQSSGNSVILKSKFELSLVPWVDAFAESIKGIADIRTIATNIQNKIPNIDERRSSEKEFFRKFHERIGPAEIDKSKLDKIVHDFLELSFLEPPLLSFDDYKKYINEYKQVLPKLKWLEEQTMPFINYELIDDKTPKFYSKLFDPEKKLPKKGNEITYSISLLNKEDTIKVENKYTKHNLIRIYPTVGVGYVFGSRTNSTYIGKGQFEPDFDFGNIEPYVGVKWYPWKMNITNDLKTRKYIKNELGNRSNVMRGNAQLNRLAVVLAFGVQHKFLKNYIFGLSYDLIPGLSIQGGGNLFFKNNYKLNNNIATDKIEVPKVNGYVGISVDLGIASSIVKLFRRPSL